MPKLSAMHTETPNTHGTWNPCPSFSSLQSPLLPIKKTKKLPSRRSVKVTAAFARASPSRGERAAETVAVFLVPERVAVFLVSESVAVRSPSPPLARSRSKSRCPVSYRRRRRCRSYSPARYNRDRQSRSPVRSHHYSSYERDRRSYRDIREHSERSRRQDSDRYLDRHSFASRRNRSRSVSPHSRKSH
ncbi:serine/arginine repetitive matrix protein 2-like [Arachis ipaensis]|uniref:serine/arginine repetitive matrix protein 2-like n=1 Tax=Arachis ipaensis TaxID=130454 RepID=UPI000A2B8978|nr:serine/arginine repetitive matrix protein 2-like [Arachis ipaensis]XP_025658158.1 serine/arginine repetitive matrix protein 2 [Arachis hypogaea]